MFRAPPRLGLILISLLVLGVIWRSWQILSAPLEREANVQYEVRISPGQGVGDIARQLEQRKIIRHRWSFLFWSWVTRASAHLQAGTYLFSPAESPRQILEKIRKGQAEANEIRITFPEGFTLQQMAERLAAVGLFSAEEFKEQAGVDRWRERFIFLTGVPPGRSLEGFLFPDTYRFFRDAKPEEVIRKMLSTFEKRVGVDLVAEAKRRGRKWYEVVIMASIIEREVRSSDDMAMIADILWRRLDKEIPLQADATVRYITGDWENPLTVEQLNISSPYNTRRVRGLPPGPISNPGLRAIEAAVRPQPNDYLYYLSTPDGKTIYSRTLEEHNAAKAKYLR
jgi:UPF0755 protein